MDKGKQKKKETSTKGGKTTRKKVSPKKTEKSTKKKKTIKKNEKHSIKNNDNNDNNQNNTKDGESVIIDQKENSDQNLEDKLNQPLTKKKLPPIQKNGENNELENEEDNIKEEEKIEEKKEIIKAEMSCGTPYFYNLQGLKNDLEEKNNKINEENSDQEKYKISLNNLLNDLNKILSENADLLYNKEEDEIKRKKKEKINDLQNALFAYQQLNKDTKEKNKTYKQHYELLSKKDENAKMAHVKEYEALF